MTWTPKYTITKEIFSYLTSIEAVKNSFDDKPLSPVLLSSLHQSAKIAQTHYSTQIEGNNLSLQQVENALHTGNKSATTYKGHDEKEVKAYYDAINYMEKHLEDNLPFSENFIQKAHALIEGQKKVIPYRDAQNAIYDSSDGSLVYLPPETKDLPEMMKDLISWVKDNIDNLPTPIVAGLFHYQFVTIHPYFDGNGRTARLITSYIMRKYGYGLKGIYSLEEYYAKNLSAYYQALATHPHHNYYYGRHEADLTSWLTYFIKGVSEAFSNVELKSKQEQTNGLTADKAPILRKLDIKQRKILELFVEYEEISSIQAGQYLNISSQSARLLLNKWVDEGFIKLVNRARKNRTYGLSEQYEAILK
ncbi:MAG: Fic family protein [Alphaproteobacteria bacterium]|nr:Fic family protein [Alphaproteobacteria bacterium]